MKITRSGTISDSFAVSLKKMADLPLFCETMIEIADQVASEGRLKKEGDGLYRVPGTRYLISAERDVDPDWILYEDTEKGRIIVDRFLPEEPQTQTLESILKLVAKWEKGSEGGPGNS